VTQKTPSYFELPSCVGARESETTLSYAKVAKITSVLRRWASWAKFTALGPFSGHARLSQGGGTILLGKESWCF